MTERKLPALDQLENLDPQTIAEQCKMPVVWADHQVTRRQRIHGLSTPGYESAYSSTHLCEIIQELDHRGHRDALFICQTPTGKHLGCYIIFQELEQ